MSRARAILGALGASLAAALVVGVLLSEDEPVAAHERSASSRRGATSTRAVPGATRHAQGAADPSVLGSSALAAAPSPRGDEAPGTELRPAAPARGVLTGRIVDEQGAPVLSPELVLLDADGESEILGPDRLNLAPGGGYRVEVGPGTWSLQARAPEHSDSQPTSVRVAAGCSPPHDFVLTRHGILRGTVQLPPEVRGLLPRTFRVVLEASNDEPPSLATIDSKPEVHLRRVDVWVGHDRSFELRDCVPGLYRVRFELPRPGGGWVGPWAQTWLEPGQVREGVQLRFPAEADLSVAGLVLDTQGLAVEGARVTAGPHLATTDAQGRFELRGLELGPHVLEVAREGHESRTEELEFLGDPLRLELRLRPEDVVEGSLPSSTRS